MIAVVYTFYVRSDRKKEFIKAWYKLTKIISKYGGIVSSKLHADRYGNYKVYALWPDEITWKEAREKLPRKADKWKSKMRESIERMMVSRELENVADLNNSNLFI